MASYWEMLNQPGVIPVCAVNANDRFTSYSEPGVNLWICAPSGDMALITNSSWSPAEWIANLWKASVPTTDLSGQAGYNYDLRPPQPGANWASLLVWHLDFGVGNFYYRDSDYRSEYVSYDGNRVASLPGTDAYTRFFGGTSAAAPVVSGVVALMRSAYPALSWRDVKLILAESAEQVDSDAESWQEGGSAYHNSESKYTHSIDYGFGLVDTPAAFALAGEWRALPPELSYETGERNNTAISSYEDNITIGDMDLDFIEYVQLEVSSPYGNFSDLDILLTSPIGTESLVARSHFCILEGLEEQQCDDLKEGFTFGSAAHLGEDTEGKWDLTISGMREPSWFAWKLRFYGHKRR